MEEEDSGGRCTSVEREDSCDKCTSGEREDSGGRRVSMGGRILVAGEGPWRGKILVAGKCWFNVYDWKVSFVDLAG